MVLGKLIENADFNNVGAFAAAPPPSLSVEVAHEGVLGAWLRFADWIKQCRNAARGVALVCYTLS
jgi:hypothetical protein